MSDEPEGLIEDVFVKQLGAKYPIVKVGGAVGSKYGIEHYPTVFSIDANGQVHTVDAMPSESDIEQMLKDVSLAPKLPDDSRFAGIRSMWDKKQHGKLQEYLGKMLAQENLDAELREVYTQQQEALQKRAGKQVERVASLAQGPDYHASTERLERIAKDWEGFPAAADAEKELARFKADAAIKKEVAAGKALAKLQSKYDPSKLSQKRKLMEELVKFAKKYEGTYAGEQAKKLSEG